MPRRDLYAIAFLGWMALITMLSLVSFSEGQDFGISLPHKDKLAHFTFHLVACVLGTLLMRTWWPTHFKSWQIILWVLFFLLIYGIIIEVLQEVYTSTREAELADLLANLSGALTGALLTRIRISGAGS